MKRRSFMRGNVLRGVMLAVALQFTKDEDEGTGTQKHKKCIVNGRQGRVKQPQMRARLWGSVFGTLLLSLCLVPIAWAQGTLGSVSVTVVDPSGGVLPGATLTLTDVATNESREGVTQTGGTYTFVNLNFG